MGYKKIIIGILLFIISFFVPCYFLAYKAFQANFKQKAKLYIKSHLKNKDVTIIEISTEELYHNSSRITWLDDNKEFVYKSELYDVITVKEKNGSIFINALSDEKEKELKIAFSETFSNLIGLNAEKSSAKKNGLPTFFIQDYIIPPFINLTAIYENISLELLSNKNMNLIDTYIHKITPPPKTPFTII